MARKHDKTVAQVIVRWHLQRNVIAIPKSVHEARIIENFDVFDSTLDATDMESIATLDQGKSNIVNHRYPAFVKMILKLKVHE